MSEERLAVGLHTRDVRGWLSCSKRKAFEEVEPPELEERNVTPVGRRIGEEVHEEMHGFDMTRSDRPRHILYDKETRSEKEMERQIAHIRDALSEWMMSNKCDIAPRTGIWDLEAKANVGPIRLTLRSNIDMIMRDMPNRSSIAVNIYTGVGDPLRLWPSAFLAAWAAKDSFDERNELNVTRMGILTVPRNAPDKISLDTFPVSDAIEMGRRLIGVICGLIKNPVPTPSIINCNGCVHPDCPFSKAEAHEQSA